MIRTYRKLMRSSDSGISSRVYNSFLNRVSQSGGTIPQAVQDLSDPLVTDYRDFDFLNIPQFNVADSVWSIKGQNITVAGGGNGSRFDENGILVTGLTNNRPRYNFDPVIGYGVYVEVQDVNILNYAILFNHPYWFLSSSNADRSISSVLSPENILNAYFLEKNAINSLDVLFKGYAGATNSGKIKSIFLRSVSGVGIVHSLVHNSVARGLLSITQDWKRYTLAFNTDELGGNNHYIIDWRGVGTTLTSAIVYGAQISDNNTSFIKTSGSPVTRTADIYTATGLINTTANHLKFYIKNGIKFAEYYDHGTGELSIYENGILISTVAYTPVPNWVISSTGSDIFKLLAYREGTFTPTYIQNL